MKTMDEVLIRYGVSITQDGNDYMKYGCTLNKIKLAMQEYTSGQCQKRDELIKAQDDMIQSLKDELFDHIIRVWDEDWYIDYDTKIERLKNEINKQKP